MSEKPESVIRYVNKFVVKDGSEGLCKPTPFLGSIRVRMTPEPAPYFVEKGSIAVYIMHKDHPGLSVVTFWLAHHNYPEKAAKAHCAEMNQKAEEADE